MIAAVDNTVTVDDDGAMIVIAVAVVIPVVSVILVAAGVVGAVDVVVSGLGVMVVVVASVVRVCAVVAGDVGEDVSAHESTGRDGLDAVDAVRAGVNNVVDCAVSGLGVVVMLVVPVDMI